MMNHNDVMRRRPLRERAAREQAERIAEEKVRALFEDNRELRKFTDHLEEFVEERTKDLVQDRDRAIAASRAKSEFLANMSHEIRTPLSAVIGLAELMLETPLNEEQADYCRTINSSGNALLAIINDILDFSKIESGRLELESIPFDIRQCIEGALDVLANKADEKGIELAYYIDVGTPTEIIGDETRLRQILLNLVNNAIKFTEVGEVTVEVQSRRISSHDDQQAKYEFTIAITDTGIGIPSGRMDCLFKSFTQVDLSTTRRFGGTGLGLAISRRLAEMMGGRMWAQSDGVGQGSTFSFTLMTDAAQDTTRQSQEGTPSDLEGKRVLLVDDNHTHIQMLRKQLECWDITVDAMANGKDALKLIDDHRRFDVAIVDLQMPEMDGIMLVREIRKRHSKQALPVLMLTSFDFRIPKEDTPQFAEILSKPVKMDVLRGAMLKVFSARSLRDPRKRNATSPTASKQPKESTASKADVRRPPTKPTGKPTEKTTTASAQSTPTPLEPSKDALRILLAEDMLVNQKVALNILKRYGYTADVVSDGVAAVAEVKDGNYDIVLMDVQMPKLDGVSAAQQIRETMSSEKQPWIIAITANALSGNRERFLAAGMDDYLSKPIDQAKLAEKLKAQTELKQQHAQIGDHCNSSQTE